ncbi:hypothetical protein BJX64DRAFT_291255 [Aspergillus heterothallicus]
MTALFSVAASVAGVLSLGLEICKRTIRYGDALRGSDTDIASLTLMAEQLAHTLGHLKRVLDDVGDLDPTLADNIREIILTNKHKSPSSTHSLQDVGLGLDKRLGSRKKLAMSCERRNIRL